jgi:hypothetical protein
MATKAIRRKDSLKMPIASDETVARYKERIAARKRTPAAPKPSADRLAEYRIRFGIEESDPRAESMMRYKKALDTACHTLKANDYKPELVAKVCREFGVSPNETKYQPLVQSIVESEAYLRLNEQIRNPKPESKEQLNVR